MLRSRIAHELFGLLIPARGSYFAVTETALGTGFHCDRFARASAREFRNGFSGLSPYRLPVTGGEGARSIHVLCICRRLSRPEVSRAVGRESRTMR